MSRVCVWVAATLCFVWLSCAGADDLRVIADNPPTRLDLRVVPNPIRGVAACATNPIGQCLVTDSCCYCSPQCVSYRCGGTNLNPLFCTRCQLNCVSDSEMEDFYQCPWGGCPPGGTSSEWQTTPIRQSFRLPARCNCVPSCIGC